jgi:anti-sigma regulatory factor (Ser/Thr protein kinase)/uncharacterized protein (DUF1330 family)
MANVRKRGESIRKYILTNVADHPSDIVRLTAQEFGISRQAVSKHIQKLLAQGALKNHGNTRKPQYVIHPELEWESIYRISDGLAEDIVWSQDIEPKLQGLPDNVLDIWAYGFSEIFNNAIEHSSGELILINLRKTSTYVEIYVVDDGEGIFRKIQSALALVDPRHAVLELAKGKLTTDPDNHTGEGIFFSSRMFEKFVIISNEVYFSHQHSKVEDWILEHEASGSGTWVMMRLDSNTSRTAKAIFDQYSSKDEYAFVKTVVPVRLAQYGNERLVSRSQAKRLLARVDKFKIVIFDFEDVNSIGQAFADEVFRVFVKKHPEIEVHAVKSNLDVQNMINRAISNAS